MSSTLAPALTVVIAALLLQVGASVVAPHFAPTPSRIGSTGTGDAALANRPGLAIPGLAGALGSSGLPSPSATFGPAPTDGRSVVVASASDDPDSSDADTDGDGNGEPDGDLGDGTPPVPVPTPKQGTSVKAVVRVSAQEVAPGQEFDYRYVARNKSDRVFRGTLTVTTHTPSGTLRCSSDLGGACVIPGDYSDGSRDPSESHMNPEAVTKTVKVRPHEGVVLFVMRVQVSQAAEEGLVLRNHAHVEGVRNGNGLVTVEAPEVRVASGSAS